MTTYSNLLWASAKVRSRLVGQVERTATAATCIANTGGCPQRSAPPTRLHFVPSFLSPCPITHGFWDHIQGLEPGHFSLVLGKVFEME